MGRRREAQRTFGQHGEILQGYRVNKQGPLVPQNHPTRLLHQRTTVKRNHPQRTQRRDVATNMDYVEVRETCMQSVGSVDEGAQPIAGDTFRWLAGRQAWQAGTPASECALACGQGAHNRDEGDDHGRVDRIDESYRRVAAKGAAESGAAAAAAVFEVIGGHRSSPEAPNAAVTWSGGGEGGRRCH